MRLFHGHETRLPQVRETVGAYLYSIDGNGQLDCFVVVGELALGAGG